MCFAPQRRALFRHLNFQKVVWDRGFLTLLTCKCASRHNGVHFFNISTSKSGPKLACFVHFDLEMCFAPQRRALFRHLNFQKRSKRQVLLPFLLTKVLRATTACTFLTSQLPRVVRTWRVLYILTCALRHNGVQMFISYLASWLRTRRFSEVTFRHVSTLQSPKSLGKHSAFRLSYLVAHLHLLSSDFPHLLSSHFLTSPSWLFPPLLFHLCILSEVWLLNFLRSYQFIYPSYVWMNLTMGHLLRYGHQRHCGDSMDISHCCVLFVPVEQGQCPMKIPRILFYFAHRKAGRLTNHPPN